MVGVPEFWAGCWPDVWSDLWQELWPGVRGAAGNIVLQFDRDREIQFYSSAGTENKLLFCIKKKMTAVVRSVVRSVVRVASCTVVRPRSRGCAHGCAQGCALWRAQPKTQTCCTSALHNLICLCALRCTTSGRRSRSDFCAAYGISWLCVFVFDNCLF